MERGAMSHAVGVSSTLPDPIAPPLPASARPPGGCAAPPPHGSGALSQVTVGELRLFRLLLGIRRLPGRLLGRPRARFDAAEPLLGWAVRFGFTILGEDA